VSETTPDAPPPPGLRVSFSLRELLIVIGIIAALISLLIGGPLEQLLFGWLYFPFRVLPQITVDWPSAILGLVSMAIFCAGLHVTIRWFLQQTAPRAWSFRATLVIAASLILMFAAGTAIVGATHQSLWLAFGKGGEGQPVRTTGLLGGGVFGAREAARRSQQRSNLKQLGLALHNFHDNFQAFPPGGTMTADGELLHGWLIFLGPYLTFSNWEMDFSQPWNSPANERFFKCELVEVVNPSMDGPYFDEDGYGLSHVAGNVRVLPLRSVNINDPTAMSDNTGRVAQLNARNEAVSLTNITDGTSSTVLLGTVGAGFKPWGHPANLRDPAAGINRGPQSFGGPAHWQGAMFLMCDGSVRMLSETTDPQVLKAMATPSGGETTPAEP
jgi:hypothetical protein